MAVERTYSMIKPDGVRARHVGEILNRFERAGLTIERMELSMLTREQVDGNYGFLSDKPFYPNLVKFMTGGPVVKLVISGEHAIAKVRALNGATDPVKAAPGTIRGDFGLDVNSNVVHGSDSPEAAAREIALFFGEDA